MNLKKLSCFTLSLLLSVFLFTGCEISQSGLELASVTDECKESGANCEITSGSGLLSLVILNQDPYQVKDPTNRIFDISGLCNEADFPENIIEFSASKLDANGNISLVVVPTSRVFNVCKRGKFRLQVTLPNGQQTTNSRLILELIGRDLTGKEFKNPLAAKRGIDLISINPPAS